MLAGTEPAWLAQRIKAWTGYYGTARLLRPVLLELPAGEILDELLAEPTTRAALRRFESRGAHAVVDVAQLDDLRASLAELGIEVEEVEAEE